MSVPAVVIAAPASGSGKTTVATGLMGALRRAGRRVAPFKVGPDFIDPGYHALAAMRPGRNLDSSAGGGAADRPAVPTWQRRRGHRGRRGRDGAVRRAHRGEHHRHRSSVPRRTSPRLLGAPVILVVDARGQSHSIAALLHGFSTFDPIGTHRGGDPQPGRLAPARGGAAAGLRTRRRAGRSARSRAPTNCPSRPGTSA